jgi:hypothetical protein
MQKSRCSLLLTAFIFGFPGAFACWGGWLLPATMSIWQGRGDSVDYYFCSQDLLEKMLQDPLSGLKLFFLPAGDAAFPYHIYYTQGPPLAMIKLSLPFYLLGAGSYWGMSLLMGSLSWLGSWALYRELLRHRKQLRWLPAFALLYLPSVLFWAGGYSKDSLIWGGLCILLWAWLRWQQKPSWLLAGGMLDGGCRHRLSQAAFVENHAPSPAGRRMA